MGLDLHFPEEAIDASTGRKAGVEDLDGHTSIVLWLVGKVDRSHPAMRDLALDHIPPSERLVEMLDLMGHTTLPAADPRPHLGSEAID
jgi:hypothetical protein